MMLRAVVMVCAALLATAAEDGWAKVKALKSGGELRVYKKGAKQPVQAKFDEANDERLLMVVKNAQVAVVKEEIERIEYRAPQSGAKARTETRTADDDPAASASKVGMPSEQGKVSRPDTGSTSSTVTFGSKGDFEVVYRRLAGK